MDETDNKTDLATLANPANPNCEATDESLVEIACSGDDTAFERIFERHRRQVTRIVGRFFRRPEKVEEIVQEIFTKLYFALKNYSKRQGKSFFTWLSSIAINSCYDELRRARRRPESSISEVTANEIGWLNAQVHGEKVSSNAESDLIVRDLADKLLARLCPEDRLILTLLDAEDLSVNEIASLMGISVSNVKVRAHRARAALRQLLKEYL